MDSFTSLNAGPFNEYRICNAQELDPKDNNYINSNANSVILTINPKNNPFRQPIKKKQNKDFKNTKENQPNFNFKLLNSYILNNGLFNYKLLDINPNLFKKVEFTCTMSRCGAKLTLPANRVQIGSSKALHYREKYI